MADKLLTLLHANFYDELRRLLTGKLSCEDDAVDVIQDAYVRLLSAQTLDPIRQPRAFFFKTALNLVIDRLRQPRQRAVHLADSTLIDSLPSSLPDPESVLASRERLRILHEAITELPPRCRQVFVLHKFGELTHREIADRLGISKNMVEKHIIKAMAHCRKRLDELT